MNGRDIFTVLKQKYLGGILENKVEFIRKYYETGQFIGQSQLLSSFISCLDSNDTCSFLDLTFCQDYFLRRLILKKIGNDIEDGLLACHKTLINNIIGSLNTLPNLKKQSAASSLAYLCDFLPENTQNEIILFLLGSKYIGVRKKGYKKVNKLNSANSWLIEQDWKIYHDFDCARILIDYFPIKFLETNLGEIQEKVLGTSYLSRLFIRLTQHDPLYLIKLRNIDEITFVYVSFKTKNIVSEELAYSIFENNKHSERIGLLIWCFGKMKFWATLEKISSEMTINSKYE